MICVSLIISYIFVLCGGIAAPANPLSLQDQGQPIVQIEGTVVLDGENDTDAETLDGTIELYRTRLEIPIVVPVKTGKWTARFERSDYVCTGTVMIGRRKLFYDNISFLVSSYSTPIELRGRLFGPVRLKFNIKDNIIPQDIYIRYSYHESAGPAQHSSIPGGISIRYSDSTRAESTLRFPSFGRTAEVPFVRIDKDTIEIPPPDYNIPDPDDANLSHSRDNLTRQYWIGARGYAPRRITIDHEKNSVVAVKLTPSAKVTIYADEWKAHKNATLSCKKKKSSAQGYLHTIEYTFDGGPLEIDNLAPGTYDFILASGSEINDSATYGSAQATLRYEQPQRVVIHINSDALKYDYADCSGSIAVPADVSVEQSYLSLQMVGNPTFVRKIALDDMFEIWRTVESTSRPANSKTKTLTWSFGHVPCAEYILTIEPFQIVKRVKITPDSVSYLELEILGSHKNGVKVIK